MGARQSLQPDVERRPRSNSAVENGVEVPIPSSRRTNSQLPPRTERVQSRYSSSDDDSDDNSGPGPSSQTVHNAAGLRFAFRPSGRTSLLQALSGSSSRRDRIPVLHFLGHDIKCPVCHKRVPSDEAEVHLVMCFTRPRIAYNGKRYRQHFFLLFDHILCLISVIMSDRILSDRKVLCSTNTYLVYKSTHEHFHEIHLNNKLILAKDYPQFYVVFNARFGLLVIRFIVLAIHLSNEFLSLNYLLRAAPSANTMCFVITVVIYGIIIAFQQPAKMILLRRKTMKRLTSYNRD